MACFNVLYHEFDLIFCFLFITRKTGGNVLRHSTQTLFCCNFCAGIRFLLHASEPFTRRNPHCFITTPGMKLLYIRMSIFVICVSNWTVRCKILFKEFLKQLSMGIFFLIHVIKLPSKKNRFCT